MSKKATYSLTAYTDCPSNDDLLAILAEDCNITRDGRDFNEWLHNRPSNDRSRVKITIIVEDAAFDS